MANSRQRTAQAQGAEGIEAATALQGSAAAATSERTAATQTSGDGQAPAAECKQFPVKLRIYMDSFSDKETQQPRPFIAAELVDPFPAYKEDYNNIRVAPRWDNDAALFKFRMGLYLKTADDIIVEGVCQEVSYESKREKGKQITYPGLFFKLPYRERPVEFGFKKQRSTDASGRVTFVDSGNSYVFRDLVAELWGGTYEAGADGSTLGDEDNVHG